MDLGILRLVSIGTKNVDMNSIVGIKIKYNKFKLIATSQLGRITIIRLNKMMITLNMTLVITIAHVTA